MSAIASRASWGPRYSDGFAVIGTGGWRDIFVHHSVTRVPGGANATVTQEQEHMRLLESIGQNNFGGGISYTVIVFPSGRAYQGHSLNTRGAHTYQRNDSARAICFVGNFEEDTPTNAAINKASNVLAEWRAAGLPSHVTGGHRDVYQTACPGRNLYAALSRIKAENATQEGEDEMSWDTPIPNHYGSEPPAKVMLAYMDEHINDIKAEQSAQRALLAELANDPDVTLERLTEVVQAAVSAANAAHLAAQRAQLDATLEVVRTIVGARDENLADEVVDEISRRTTRAA